MKCTLTHVIYGTLFTNLTPSNHSLRGHRRVLVYPPDGTGSISVTAADYDRLQPDEFLNDTLIEYGMRCGSSSFNC